MKITKKSDNYKQYTADIEKEIYHKYQQCQNEEKKEVLKDIWRLILKYEIGMIDL